MALIGMAIWCHNLPPKNLIEAIKEYTILIHPNEMVVLTNSAYSLMVQYYLQNPKEEHELAAF